MLRNYQNLQKDVNIQFTDKADVKVIMDQNYVQYYKSTSGCNEGQWLPGGCDGDRAGTHSQGLSHHTPVRRREARRQTAHPQPWALGTSMGMGTRQEQGRTPTYRWFICCLQVSSLFISKLTTFRPSFLNVNIYLVFSADFVILSLNDDSVLPNIGSVFQFCQPKILMKTCLLLISRSLVN